MPPITVGAMGASGVNVDANPLLLDSAELRFAQNVYHDTSNAHGGAIVQRKGLTPFHLAPLGGPILGGIGMAVAQTALATGGGPEPPGGSTGSGDGGPPGGTGPSGGPGGGGSSPSGPFNPSGPLFGGARLVAIGRTNTAISDRNGSWWLSDENFVDAALTVTGPPGPPNVHRMNPDVGPPDIAAGPPGVVYPDGYLYYAAGLTSSTGNQRPTVRKTNGFTDTLVATLPRDPRSTGADQSILQMIHGDGSIWITEATRGGVNRSRLFKLDPTVGTLTNCPMPTTFDSESPASGAVYYALAFHNGHVWVGQFSGTATGAAFIQPMRPTATGAVAANTTLTIGAPERGIGAMASFDGQLIIGGSATTATGAFAHIWQYTIDAATGGVSGTSIMTPTGAGATGANGNYFPSMVVFRNKLYASYYNPGAGAAIYQYDGTTWTGAYAVTTGASVRPFILQVDKNTLYAIGNGVAGSSAHYIMSSADGTTWTDRSASFVAGSTNVQPFGLLFGFDQQ